LNYPPVRLPVTERTQASEARRIAGELARRLGFAETQAGELAIVVTEAGNNLAKHATGGEILLSATGDEKSAGVEMLAIDRGPGMDVERCLRDGFSTAGTSGTGLGAIQRLATYFDAWSDASGTVLLAGFEREPHDPRTFAIGSARAAKPGETMCGDAWIAKQEQQHLSVLMADGLGHGPFASDAALEATSVFRSQTFLGAADMVRLVHGGLRGTRGAAIGVAEIDLAAGKVRYSGLGNIAGVLVSASRVQNLVSMNGTAGHQAARIGEFEYTWPEGGLLIMHSDGLGSSWALERYPGLSRRHPSVIAGVLYRDYSRGRDDVAVVVVSVSRV
jgi:anti-sigma regulatory factor (Ser/Thr protein kinase)